MKSIKAFAGSFSIKSDGARRFEGYGSIFGNVDSYNERVIKGAFLESLKGYAAKGRMPSLLWQHDPSLPIGVYHEMAEDSKGLYVSGELADTQLGNEAYTLMKMGALSGLSIGYEIKSDAYDRTTDIRDLTGVELWEVSPVTFPANDEARIDSVKAASIGYKGLERILRGAGISRSEAKLIASRGFEALREVANEDLSIEEAESLIARITGR